MDYTTKDEQLYIEVQRMMAGDFSNYEAFYNLSMNYIYKIIYDIVKDYETTQDLLQETYVRIYNSISQLQDPRAFFAWAGRIATNLTFRHLQKYRLETLAYENEEGELEYFFDRASEDQEAFIPEDILVKNSTRRILAQIIDGLSPEQKIAVQYYYFEDMSVREIAQAMECSTGTVKSRLNYARNAIKNAVLSIEQTQGIRLHSMAAFPILWYVFRESAETFFFSQGAAAAAGTVGAMGYANTLGSVGAAGYANTMGEIGAGAVNNAAVGAGSVNNAVVGATGIGTGTSVGAAGVGVSGGTVAGTAGAASATSAGVVAATGLSLGAKIAIAVGGLLAVGGISAGAIHIAQSHKKTTETTTIETTMEEAQEAEIVETTEEVTTEEVVDVDGIFKSYVKDTLIPEYGLSGYGMQSKHIETLGGDSSFEYGGIETSYIYDLDRDGQNELMVVWQEPFESENLDDYYKNYCHKLSVYEYKDNQVIMEASTYIEHYIPRRIDNHGYYTEVGWKRLLIEGGTLAMLDLNITENHEFTYFTVGLEMGYYDAWFRSCTIYHYDGYEIYPMSQAGSVRFDGPSYDYKIWFEDVDAAEIIDYDWNSEKNQYQEFCLEMMQDYGLEVAGETAGWNSGQIDLYYPAHGNMSTTVLDLVYYNTWDYDEVYDVYYDIEDYSGFREW